MDKLTVNWTITPIKWRAGSVSGFIKGGIWIYHNTSRACFEVYQKCTTCQIFLENVGNNEIILYTLDNLNNWVRRAEGNEIVICGDVEFLFDGDCFKIVGTTVDQFTVDASLDSDDYFDIDEAYENEIIDAESDVNEPYDEFSEP